MFIIDTKEKLYDILTVTVQEEGKITTFENDFIIIGQHFGRIELKMMSALRFTRSTIIFFNCIFDSGFNFRGEFYLMIDSCLVKFINCDLKKNLMLNLEGIRSSSFILLDSFVGGTLAVIEGINKLTVINSIIYELIYGSYLTNSGELRIISSVIDSVDLHMGSSYVGKNAYRLSSNGLEIANSEIELFKVGSNISKMSKKESTYKSLFGDNIKHLEISGVISESDLSDLDIRNIRINSALFLYHCNVDGLNLSKVSVVNLNINKPPLYFNRCSNVNNVYLPEGDFIVKDSKAPPNCFFVPLSGDSVESNK